MTDVLISASILSADFGHLADQIQEVQRSGVDWLHIDVMDGHFVPNITMGPFIVQTCRNYSTLPLDVHLMIEKPEQHIEAFARAGASGLTVHFEGNPNIHRLIEQIHSLGCKAGISINPGTPAQFLEAVLPFVDMVLLMTVNPGFSGQKFIPQMAGKIATLHNMIQQSGRPIRLQVDGGITPENLPQVVASGADTIVAATSIFGHPSGIQAGVDSLRQVLL